MTNPESLAGRVAREYLIRRDSRFHSDSYMPECFSELVVAIQSALDEARLDELKNHGVEHCAGHSDAPGSCGTCWRIAQLEAQSARVSGTTGATKKGE